jgi:triacylglycerol lipase
LTCPRLQAPIVLAHGLFGFVRIGLGPITLARYFQGIPEFLQASGNRVLVSRVHPTAGIDFRAWKLGTRIEAAFGDESVHLIGHSMGGLDARVLLADPAWAGRILSVTTIGTPHRGSALADAAGLRMGKVYRLLERLNWDHRGFLHVTRRAARDWDRRLHVPGDVPCFSVAGDPASEQVCWPLRRLHEVLRDREGPNDGLVPVSSAIAFGNPLPSWPTDHLRQMGWLIPEDRDRPRLPILNRYAGIVANLARLGFGEPVESPVEESLAADW